MPLYAGTCQTNITPPPGVWMSGYAFRPSGCLGIHDELWARAIVFDGGVGACAILAADLIGLDLDIVRRVRGEVAERTGIPSGAILLNCSHTHAGPATLSFNAMGPLDAAYIDVLTRKLVGVLCQAARSLRPARLAWGEAPVQIGVNRRQTRGTGGRTILGENYAGPVAPGVTALVVTDPGGRPFAVVYSHACHGTTLGGANLQISGEWMGSASRAISEATDQGAMPLFLQGCCGNINPLRRESFEAVEQNGCDVAEAALAAIEVAEAIEAECPGGSEIVVDLPLNPPPDVMECKARIAEHEADAAEARRLGDIGRAMHSDGLVRYFRTVGECALAGASHSSPFAIQRLRIGEAAIVAMPAEVVVQYQLDFVAQSPGPVMTLGYSNGVLNYLPTEADHALGGYEVESAHVYYNSLMFAPESERLVRNAAYALLDVVNPDRTPYGV